MAAFAGMSFRHNDTAAVLFGRYSLTPDFGTGALPTGSDSLFVAQYDISGNVAWAKGYPSASGIGAKMSRRNDTPSGGAPEVWLVGGVYTGSANLGGGTLPPWPTPSKKNVYVAALDMTGNTAWSRALGSGPMPDDIGLSGIRQQISASYVVGTVRGDLDVGAGTMPSAGGSDVYVARLATSDGSTVWSKRYGGSGDETALVAMGLRAFITGTTSAGVDFGDGPLPPGMYLVSYDFSAQSFPVVWQKSFPGCQPEHIAVATEVAVIASCTAPLDAGSGLMPAGKVLMSFRATDGLHWRARPIPSAPVVYGGLTIGAAPYVLGTFQSAIDFGTAKLTSPGTKDLFIARWWASALDQ